MLEYLVFWDYKSEAIDFTHDELGKLDAKRQLASARAYQEWYATSQGLAKEKTIENRDGISSPGLVLDGVARGRGRAI
jgi:hypothetical protein